MAFPISALYASLLALLLIALSARVSKNRRRAKVSLGHGEDVALERAIRAQGNFVEYVPIGLLMLVLLEAETGHFWVLHVLGAMLLLGRLLHAWGIGLDKGVNFGRFWGAALTWIMIISCALLNLYHLL